MAFAKRLMSNRGPVTILSDKFVNQWCEEFFSGNVIIRVSNSQQQAGSYVRMTPYHHATSVGKITTRNGCYKRATCLFVYTNGPPYFHDQFRIAPHIWYPEHSK